MSIKEKITAVQKEMKSKATLIAVSKQQPIERIEEALSAGQRVFGENRVQEAQQRWHEYRNEHPDLVLHLIGPLQSNKAAEAVTLFDVIHTIDREKITKALSDEMKKQKKDLPCFIQVNIGDEDQKSGVAIKDLESLYIYATQECGLNIIGLMCIPPLNRPAALYFCLLKKLATQLGLKELSMGMSDDYEKAVACGATHVRVGSKIFGSRI
ncbi:MAG: YggS family pyridoxal phosphate-dependent enzyme [Micavibrio sp.]|nr:YggS family pyridoxal phosphate-dependent enzyme [Micavibrio sp.]|tara:strand:+ start:759 stop:1391 length:633 start_codon:yes stop_codon:yes gene_type:complete